MRSNILSKQLLIGGFPAGIRPSANQPALLSLARSRIPTISLRSYHEKVIDHYEKPRNVGSLDKKSQAVGTGLVGAPACGDVMKLQILVDEASRRITDVKFKTFGCGSAIASSSFATEKIKGMTLEEAATGIKNTVIAKELSLPPVKLHCSMLAEDAVKAAIKDYIKKNPNVSSDFELAVKQRERQPASAN